MGVGICKLTDLKSLADTQDVHLLYSAGGICIIAIKINAAMYF